MFNEVIANAELQQELYKTEQSTLIDDYYPEVHDGAGPVACTIGNNLIPDLLTRRRILIDLDDLPSEDSLIERFGVDKRFLLKLRDEKLVVIATNLKPARHRTNTWMHDILANKETIFKWCRTPHFFRASYPDIEEVQQDYHQYLARKFETLSNSTYTAIISHMDAIPWKASRSGAAEKLAWDIARVHAMLGKDRDSAPVAKPDEVFQCPSESMDFIYRYKMLAVSPHSGALGATMLVPYAYMKRLFPETPQSELLVQEHVLPEDIMAYLTRVSLKTEPAETTAPEYWHRLRPLERDKLFDVLKEEKEREASADVELDLRLRIAKSDPDITLDEIKDLVEADMAWVDKHGKLFEIGYTALWGSVAVFFREQAAWLGPSSALVGKVLEPHALRLLETAVPRLRVANYVRSRRSR
ncbi:MAG: hypothetical protein ACOYBO_04130 [Azonexus sp.]